jgi:hypothetical protein
VRRYTFSGSVEIESGQHANTGVGVRDRGTFEVVIRPSGEMRP